MRQVLVAVDDSTTSERVSEFVNRFFGDLDVSITAINVGTTPLTWSPYPAGPGVLHPWPYPAAVPPGGVQLTAEPGAAQHTAERTLRSSSLHADDEVVEVGADVAETLRRVADARDVDLLVVGSGHKGLIERLFNPSVSRDLAKDAPTPVLVVH